MEKYDVIVVGAGISGLLSALALSKEGKSVLVLEKSNFLGGNCRTYEVGGTGYFVDTGVHAITGLKSGPLVTLIERYFSVVPKFMSHGHYYIRDWGLMEKFPNTLHGLARLRFLGRKEKLILSKLVIEAITDVAVLRQKDASVSDYVQKYNLPPHTLRFLDALCYFLSGVSMEETPAWRVLSGGGLIGEGERNMRRKMTDMVRLALNSSYSEQGYPRGGVGNIVHCILRSLPKGATIRTSQDVIKITRSGGKFIVCACESKYSTDIVVYSAEAKKLPHIAQMPPKWSASVNKIRQSKAITIWLGLKKRIKALDYIGSEVWFREGVSYWAMPTSNYDPHVAPKGKQLAGFSTFMPYEQNAASYEKKLLETIQHAIPELKENIEMKHVQVMVPEKGAVSVGVKFPSVKTPVKNLYLVGTDSDMRSMGITRAAYSVLKMLEIMGSGKTKDISHTRYPPKPWRPLAGIRHSLPASMAHARANLLQ